MITLKLLSHTTQHCRITTLSLDTLVSLSEYKLPKYYDNDLCRLVHPRNPLVATHGRRGCPGEARRDGLGNAWRQLDGHAP